MSGNAKQRRKARRLAQRRTVTRSAGSFIDDGYTIHDAIVVLDERGKQTVGVVTEVSATTLAIRRRRWPWIVAAIVMFILAVLFIAWRRGV